MNNLTLLDLNNSQNKILKQIWPVGNKHLVLIDESIIQKLGIDDSIPIFVQQELSREDDNTILMRIKKTSQRSTVS